MMLKKQRWFGVPSCRQWNGSGTIRVKHGGNYSNFEGHHRPKPVFVKNDYFTFANMDSTSDLWIVSVTWRNMKSNHNVTDELNRPGQAPFIISFEEVVDQCQKTQFQPQLTAARKDENNTIDRLQLLLLLDNLFRHHTRGVEVDEGRKHAFGEESKFRITCVAPRLRQYLRYLYINGMRIYIIPEGKCAKKHCWQRCSAQPVSEPRSQQYNTAAAAGQSLSSSLRVARSLE
jgi:hypothetical protein